MRYLKYSMALGAVALIFSGCATTELQTQTKMTSSIFLEPVKKEQKTVFVSIKNTSGQDMSSLEPKIVAKLNAKGYKIVDDPDAAKYTLMTNVLFANNLKEANAARAGVNGAIVGSTMGFINSGGNGNNALGAALLVGGASAIAGKLTEDEIYRMVTDVVVRERKNTKVLTTINSSQGQASIGQESRAGFMNSFAGEIKSNDGAGGVLNSNQHTAQTQQLETDYVEHKTRVFSEAVKMNLKLDEALPVLIEKMSEQISGIF
jgi:hypothetical protein